MKLLRLFIATRPRAQGSDAELVHHVPLVLFGGGRGACGSCASAAMGAARVHAKQKESTEYFKGPSTRILPSGMLDFAQKAIYFRGHRTRLNMKHALKNRTILLLLLTLGFAAISSMAQQPTSKAQLWIATWGSSQQVPEPQNALAPDDLRDATVRQIVHLSVGGTKLRVHLSNSFGTEALHFTSVHIARPISTASPAIDPATEKALSFGGSKEVTIPPGADFVSDPIQFSAAPLSNLAITFHLDTPPVTQTSHPGSRATSYYLHGDSVAGANLISPKRVDHWYQISEVDVLTASAGATIVALGDSITDGHGSSVNGNDRWTDALAERLQAFPATQGIGVTNQGIGGNHLLTDGLGPNALAALTAMS